MSKNRLTKQEMRHDPVKEGLAQAFSAGTDFWKTNGTSVSTVAVIFILGVLGGLWLSGNAQERTLAANQSLSSGFEAFNAPILAADSPNIENVKLSFPTAEEKFTDAAAKFNQTYMDFPDRRAGQMAGLMEARCLSLLDKNDEAMSRTEELLKKAGGTSMEPFLLQVKGELLSTQGKFDEAFEVFSRLSESSQGSHYAVEGTLAMARTRHLQGQEDDGRDILKNYLAGMESEDPKPAGYQKAQDLLRDLFNEELPAA